MMTMIKKHNFRTVYYALHLLLVGSGTGQMLRAGTSVKQIETLEIPEANVWRVRLQEQQNRLSALLERCVFEFKTKRITLADANALQVFTALQKLLREAQVQDRQYALMQVHVTVNDTIVRTLRMLLAKEPVKTPLVENPYVFKHYARINTDMCVVNELYAHTDALIARTVKDLDNWGLSKINRGARTIQNALEERHIDVAIKRVLPYVCAGLLFVYLNDKSLFESSRVPGLAGLKRTIGTMPGKERIIGKDKWVGLETMQRVLNPAIFLVPVATGDAKRAYEWVSDMVKKGLAYAQGESYSPPSPIRESKIKFDDIYGNVVAKEFLTDMAHYLFLEKRIQRSGHPMAKSCLFIGNLAIGRDLGHAIASKATQIFVGAGSRKKCGVYDIHASLLVTMPLDMIVKEAEKNGPCVVVINELDWLFSIKNLDPKIASDVINTLAKTVSPTSKKQVIVVATARSIEKIPNVLLSSTCFGNRIAVEELSDVQRKKIIVEHAAKCGVSLEDELLTTMVQKTAHSSKNDLILILNHAFTTAQINQEPLATRHIKRVLDLCA